jgi:hypothetical protein
MGGGGVSIGGGLGAGFTGAGRGLGGAAMGFFVGTAAGGGVGGVGGGATGVTGGSGVGMNPPGPLETVMAVTVESSIGLLAGGLWLVTVSGDARDGDRVTVGGRRRRLASWLWASERVLPIRSGMVRGLGATGDFGGTGTGGWSLPGFVGTGHGRKTTGGGVPLGGGCSEGGGCLGAATAM